MATPKTSKTGPKVVPGKAPIPLNVVPVPGTPHLEPPHNVHLARKLNMVKCRVDLYKIPPQCINFKPTKTHLYLDTFKFTKKFRLNIRYPEGVEVDTDVEAEFDSGVLRCSFPIVQDPNRPAGLDEVVAARESIKDMRAKGIPIPLDLAKQAKLAKVRERAQPEEVVAPADKKAKDQKPKSPKKAKKPLSNKEKRQLEKAKRALEEENEVDGPKKKKAKKEKKEPEAPKNKSFMENASDALEVADQVNDQQEQALQEKMDREYAKLTVDHRKKIERNEKKLQLRALRKQEAEKDDQEKPKKEKNKKKKTKVSFAE